jgi:hypothetical protein
MIMVTTEAKLDNGENKMSKKTVLMIDPPSGWKYGFPMPLPDPRPESTTAWLVEQGYPQAEIDLMGKYFYCRYWEAEINDDHQDNR